MKKDYCARVRFDTVRSGRGFLRSERLTRADGYDDAFRSYSPYDYNDLDDVLAGVETPTSVARRVRRDWRQQQLRDLRESAGSGRGVPLRCVVQQIADYLDGVEHAVRDAIADAVQHWR